MSARAIALALVVAGCGDNQPSPFDDPASIEVVSMPVRGSTALDILLVVDDSPAVAHVQLSLSDGIDALLEPLEAAATGTLELHLGITTSDYGTTALRDPAHPGPPLGQVGNGGCVGAGKDGALIVTGASAADRYLIDGSTKNYTGARHDVLGQMAKVGSGGCGFEQPLAASVRAFENPTNAGFRRADANLLILFVQDEDDCSLLDPAMLGPPTDALGPLQSFRCTRFGVTCTEDIATDGPKHDCHARHDSPYVVDVDELPGRFRSLVPDPSRLVVGLVSGPPAPFAIEQRTPPGGGTTMASLAHSCAWLAQTADLQVADPAVRMTAFVEQFEAHGAPTSVCAQDLRPSLTEIARVAKQMFGVACLDTTTLRDRDTLAGVQPACSAILITEGSEATLPACPADGACFELVVDATACAETSDHLRFVVNEAPADAYVRARCEVP